MCIRDRTHHMMLGASDSGDQEMNRGSKMVFAPVRCDMCAAGDRDQAGDQGAWAGAGGPPAPVAGISTAASLVDACNARPTRVFRQATPSSAWKLSAIACATRLAATTDVSCI